MPTDGQTDGTWSSQTPSGHAPGPVRGGRSRCPEALRGHWVLASPFPRSLRTEALDVDRRAPPGTAHRGLAGAPRTGLHALPGAELLLSRRGGGSCPLWPERGAWHPGAPHIQLRALPAGAGHRASSDGVKTTASWSHSAFQTFPRGLRHGPCLDPCPDREIVTLLWPHGCFYLKYTQRARDGKRPHAWPCPSHAGPTGWGLAREGPRPRGHQGSTRRGAQLANALMVSGGADGAPV